MADVLVVDDDPLSLEFVRQALNASKHSLFTATDWASMNQQLTSRRFPVILLDLNLPGLRGDQLADIVMRRLVPPPVIILWSAQPAAELRDAAKRISVQHTLTKGTSREHLAKMIDNAVREFELKQKEKPLPASTPGSLRPKPDATQPGRATKGSVAPVPGPGAGPAKPKAP